MFCRKSKAAAQSLRKQKVRTDMYFPEHKFAVEIDEEGHTDKNQDEENERQTKIEKHSDCKFLHRINPDTKLSDVFVEISKIQNYITQSNEEKIKKQENKIKEQKDKIKELEKKKRTKEQICKRIIQLLVKHFYAIKTHQVFC